MKGFKNSTRTQYMKGGSCEGYAKGGSVKGAAKIAKVMGEFKSGTLHSGSKKGPEVTSKKQATAIALSEARKAGAKIAQPVQKKSLGGVLKKISPAYALGSSKAGETLMKTGLLGGIIGGPILASLLKKKQSGQPLTPAENQQLAQAQQQGQTAMKNGGKVVKKDVGGTVTDPRQARVDNKAARMEARMDARVDARADRMAARDARQEARMEARDARRDAAQARQASMRETVNAAMPARGPGGAGFNGRPAFGAGSRQREVQPAPGQAVMKKGGLAVMPKGKRGKC